MAIQEPREPATASVGLHDYTDHQRTRMSQLDIEEEDKEEDDINFTAPFSVSSSDLCVPTPEAIHAAEAILSLNPPQQGRKQEVLLQSPEHYMNTGPLSVSSDMSVPTPRLNQALEDVGLMSATDSQFPGEPLFGASEQYDYMSPLSVASTNSSVPTPKIVEAVDSLLADQSHQQGLVMRQVHNTGVPINSPKPGCSWYDDSGYNTRGPTTSNKVASKVVRFDLPTVIPHSPPESELRQLHGSTSKYPDHLSTELLPTEVLLVISR